MKKEIDDLLARYFGGNASETDMQALEQWISMSDENQQYFNQTNNLYENMRGSDVDMPKPNAEHAKKAFMSYISKNNYNKPKQVFEIKYIPFYKNRMFQVASIALIIMLSFSALIKYYSEHEMVLATQMEFKHHVLPDNTQIKLSKNSKITYSSNFGKDNKILKLEGEANFSVGHSGNGTLQIQANETFIEDVGTVFAVTAYPESNFISVKVSEGEVRFYTKDNKGLVIKANETGAYNKQTKTFKVLALKSDSLAPKGTMHVEFQEMVLNDAIDIISNAYNVNINLSEKSIGDRKITVNFDGEDVNLVLQIIAETLDLKLEKGDTGYLLSNNKKLTKE